MLTSRHTFGRQVVSCVVAASLASSLGGCGVLARREHEAANVPDEPTAVGDTSKGTREYDTIATSEEGYGAMSYEIAAEPGYTDVEVVDWNTEEYATIEERGFISAATSPLSTISSDVDTASYCNLRRMLRQGLTADEIDTGAVRIEEMLNYFTYDYATGSGDDLFGTTVHVGDCPWNRDTKLVTFGFATAPEATSIADAGSNLVFLIDISGSMDSADKLGLLKESFGKLVENLGPKDRVSIVTYANGEDVVLEGAHGDEGRKIMRAINRLQADGATNGEAGLKMAYEQAQKNFIEGGVNRIVMASDGDLNVGMSSESDLHDYVDKQRETGIYLSVLGFGSGNYKDNKMETLADHGNGNYHYIDCIEEAERVLGEDLMANLVPLCDDVKLQVEWNPAQVKGYRLIGYENRKMADEDFRNDEKDAGDVGPGAQFTVAYEVAPADSKQEVVETDLKYGDKATGNAKSDEWATATIRYRPAGGKDARERTQTAGERDLSSNPGEDWNFQAAVIELGMLLRDSQYKGSADRGQIEKLLKAGGDSEEREGFAELVDLALE